MNGIGAIIALVLLVMFGPPLLLAIIGLSRRKTSRQAAKVLFILAAVWLIVGGGICATILTS